MKFAPDVTLDKILDYVATANRLVICSGSPTDYTSASATNMLAYIQTSSGCYVKAADVSGRKLTVAAQTGIPIVNSGDALAVALLETSASALLYVTTASFQTVTAGGSLDTNSWKINIQQAV